MTAGMLLTQLAPMRAPVDSEARAVDFLASSAARDAASTRYYRSIGRPDSYAMVETFETLQSIEPTFDSSRIDGQFALARHVCVEVADGGSSHAPAPILMIVAFCVPESRRQEVDEWYEQEHAPLLLKADGWLRARRYHTVLSQGHAQWTHVALHDLRDVAVLDSRERAFARSTAWRARLSCDPWFEQAGRWVYERIGAAELRPTPAS
jgi:hypothetical protein